VNKNQNKKIKVLITGANGFVGTNLTDYLADSNFDVYAMVRPHAPINFLHQLEYSDGEKTEKRFKIVEANIRDSESIDKVVQGMNVIVHLAGKVADWGNREEIFKSNVDGTRLFLKAASKYGINRFIFLSSLTVHSLSGHHYDDETTPRDVSNFFYGESKRKAEDLVYEWAEGFSDRQAASIRPGFIIFGPYDKNSYIKALEGILTRKFGFINGGKRLISYVYVKNLCYGIYQLILAERINGAYNILDGNMTWKDWVNRWTKFASIKPLKLNMPYFLLAMVTGILVGIYKLFKIQKSPILNFYRIAVPRKDLAFLNTKMKTEIGYKPPFSLEEGQKATLEYYYSETYHLLKERIKK
jgi:nucleoside-diphosphate-sugar epimerase